jgi:hypothetical protein
MVRKLLSLVCLWWLINFYFSCCPGRPYYAYSSINLITPLTEIDLTDSLILILDPYVTGYVAWHPEGLVTSASALSCEEGFDGPKFPITSYDIITVNEFDDEHPAGSSVTDLFWIKFYRHNNYIENHILLSELQELRYLFHSQLYTKARPTSSATQIFVVSLRNSKGDEFELETPSLAWL